jgi:hypothetical protein
MRASYIKDKTPTISSEGLLFWWAHQDWNPPAGAQILSARVILVSFKAFTFFDRL